MSTLLFLLLFLRVVAGAIPGVNIHTIDGSGNNINNPTWGQADTPLVFEPYNSNYADNIGAVSTSLPSPREVSNRIFVDDAKPSLSDLNTLHVALGQAVSHDIMSTTGKSGESLPISVPRGDPFYDPTAIGGQTLDFGRSSFADGVSTPRRPINLNTAYVDLSLTYGSSESRLSALRNGNYLSTSEDSSGASVLLSLNDKVPPLANDNPAGTLPDEELFVSGDPRVNVWPLLMSMHTLTSRSHNMYVDRFVEEGFDGDVFEEARRWNIARWQALVFNEYVASTIGEELPPYEGYKEDVNAQLSVVFSSIVMRYGHSEVSSLLYRTDVESGEALEPVVLRETYDNSNLLKESNGMEEYLVGAFGQRQHVVDTKFVDDIRNFLWLPPLAGGNDLVSVNIQRNRDHGVPLFNDLRESLGLARYTSMDEISSDPLVVQALEAVYGNVNAVEGYVGAFAEDPAPPSIMGEVLTAEFKRQFTALRDGDRFFYKNTNVTGFNEEELLEIDNQGTLRQLISDTTNIDFTCPALFYNKNGPSSCQGGTDGTGNTVSVLDGEFVFSWEFSGDEIVFEVDVATTGWLSIGFSRNGGFMLDSDAIIVFVDADGQGVAGDYDMQQVRGVSCPGVCRDVDQGGSEDVELLSAREEDGRTIARFKRLLDTGDDRDVVISRSEPMDILFAFSPDNSDTLGYHAGKKAAFQIDLSSGSSSSNLESNLDDYLSHGILMFISWCVIFPLGIIIPRFCKSLFIRWWFRMHMGIQYMGAVLVVCGLIVAIEATAARGIDHFQNTHAQLGLATVLFAFIVPALGQITSLVWSSETIKEPLFPHKLHYFTGYVAPILAFASVFLGLDAYDADDYWYILAAIWIGVGLIAYILFFIRQRLSINEARGNAPTSSGAGDSRNDMEEDQDWSSD